MILKLQPVSAIHFSVDPEWSFLCLYIIPFINGDDSLVFAVQALRTCSLTVSTGISSTVLCILPREGYLKTEAFLAAPRKFNLLLLVPVSRKGDLSSDEEEVSGTVVVLEALGKSTEALLAPSFFFFLQLWI